MTIRGGGNPHSAMAAMPLGEWTRVEMRVEIARIHAEIGATMIYVTHDQVEPMTLADRIVIINHGEIEQVGAPLEVYDRPKNLFVAGFLGQPKMNFLPGILTEVRVGAAT